MAIPFTIDQSYGVFRDYNTAVWPVQWILAALGLAAVVAVLRPQPWTGVAVSGGLGFLWAWLALAYHLALFTRISAAAYGFATLSAVGAVVFIWQGVVRRKLAFRWTRSPLIVPLLWCLVGAQAALFLGVQPDLGLIAAGVVGTALLATARPPLRTYKP